MCGSWVLELSYQRKIEAKSWSWRAPQRAPYCQCRSVGNVANWGVHHHQGRHYERKNHPIDSRHFWWAKSWSSCVWWSSWRARRSWLRSIRVASTRAFCSQHRCSPSQRRVRQLYRESFPRQRHWSSRKANKMPIQRGLHCQTENVPKLFNRSIHGGHRIQGVIAAQR